MEIIFMDEIYELEFRGLRKILHSDVNKIFNEIEEPDEDAYEELATIHALISAQDGEGLAKGTFDNFYFQLAEVDDSLKAALELAGYQVEESFASRSLYAINDSGIEVRISDHKRKAIVEHGVYIGEHEYAAEIIVRGNIVRLHELKENGFSKLNKLEYILG